MKKTVILVLVLVLTVSVFAGCRRNPQEDTTPPTTTENIPAAPTPDTRPAEPQTEPKVTVPDADELIPDRDDTIDPENGDSTVNPTEGANKDDNSRSRSRKLPRP